VAREPKGRPTGGYTFDQFGTEREGMKPYIGRSDERWQRTNFDDPRAAEIDGATRNRLRALGFLR
jgi:hypothetical protein